MHIMQLWRKKEEQYAISCATCPQSDEALRDFLHKHGVRPVLSSWVNMMNKEARKKARTAGKDNDICVCGGTLPVSCAVSHGRCYLSCTCDLHMGLAMDMFRAHV